jgi:diacylglycerol kinase (ATP)
MTRKIFRSTAFNFTYSLLLIYLIILIVMNFLFDKRKGKVTVFDKGLYSGIKREPSVRVIFIFLIIGIAIAQKYENDFNMKVILIGSLLLIFVTEIINTSIEAVVDRISLKHHELSGYAKDLASTATFIWVIFAIIIWARWISKQYKNRNKENKNMFNNPVNTIFYILIVVLITIPIAFLLHYIFNITHSFKVSDLIKA